MPIDITKLCDKLDHAGLKSWLHINMPEIIDAIESMGDSIMESSIADLINNSMQRVQLARFLKGNIPETIVPAVVDIPLGARILVGPGVDPLGVFSHYNPYLLRFPMQIMYHSPNRDMLLEAVKNFIDNLGHKAIVKRLVWTDRAYIEYLPRSLADLSIPPRNWEIDSWLSRRKNK